jgi:hypothetical protein
VLVTKPFLWCWLPGLAAVTHHELSLNDHQRQHPLDTVCYKAALSECCICRTAASDAALEVNCQLKSNSTGGCTRHQRHMHVLVEGIIFIHHSTADGTCSHILRSPCNAALLVTCGARYSFWFESNLGSTPNPALVPRRMHHTDSF